LRFGLVGMLILSAYIRLWGISEVPFTYDELSAIFRAKVATWNEHWQQGVMPDGHPPGMQTLIWLWVRFSGEHAPLMHCILAIFSTVSVFFVYKTVKNLSTPIKALSVGLLYSLSYLPLLWGNQIRPYALGMFFCNAFFWQWSLIWTGKRTNNRAFIVLGTLGAACAWMHYFAILPVLLLGLIGMVKQNEIRVKWLLCALIAFLLFAPALPVFLHQLGVGGLDWLGKPRIYFPVRHLQYLLNGLIYAALLVIALTSLWRWQKPEKKDRQLALLSISFFLFPMVFGFIWSWFNKPVLQHTVLLFSAPFFFMALIGIISDKKLIYFTPVMALLMGFGLIKTGYFGDGRKDVYHEQAKVLKTSCGQQKLLLADGPDDVLMYHLSHEHDVCLPKFISHSKIPFSYNRLWNIWSAWPFKDNPIILAVNSGSNPGIIPLLEHWTGKEAGHEYFVGGELVYMNDSNTNQKVAYQTQFIETNKPFDIHLVSVGFQKNNLIVIHVPDTLGNDAELIGSLHNGNKQIDWRSAKKNEFAGIGDGSMFLFIKTADIPGITNVTSLSILLKSVKLGIKVRVQYRLCRSNPDMYVPGWFE